MARPREYDPDVVIERAMQRFWTNGYHATSIDDLCIATQLNRSSLYTAFGDKRTLFLMAMDHYGDREVARTVEALSNSLGVGRAVAQFFGELVEQIVAGRGRMGCLIGNAAVEVAAYDREVAACVRRNLDRVEAAFREALAKAKAHAEISEHIDIRAVARFYVAGAQGLRLIGKTTAERSILEDIAKQICGL